MVGWDKVHAPADVVLAVPERGRVTGHPTPRSHRCLDIVRIARNGQPRRVRPLVGSEAGGCHSHGDTGGSVVDRGLGHLRQEGPGLVDLRLKMAADVPDVDAGSRAILLARVEIDAIEVVSPITGHI